MDKEVGLYWTEGWRAPLMFYRFKCPVHGWVVSYASGYSKRLECPLCLAEARGALKDLAATRAAQEPAAYSI